MFFSAAQKLVIIEATEVPAIRNGEAAVTSATGRLVWNNSVEKAAGTAWLFAD